jgi:hypothetical protein
MSTRGRVAVDGGRRQMGSTVRRTAARRQARSVAPGGASARPGHDHAVGPVVAPGRHHRWVTCGGQAGPQALMFPWRESCIAPHQGGDHGPAWTRSRGLSGVCAPASRGGGKMPARLETLANSEGSICGDRAALGPWCADQRPLTKLRHRVAHPAGLTTLRPKWGSLTVGRAPYAATHGRTLRANSHLPPDQSNSADGSRHGGRRP